MRGAHQRAAVFTFRGVHIQGSEAVLKQARGATDWPSLMCMSSAGRCLVDTMRMLCIAKGGALSTGHVGAIFVQRAGDGTLLVEHAAVLELHPHLQHHAVCLLRSNRHPSAATCCLIFDSGPSASCHTCDAMLEQLHNNTCAQRHMRTKRQSLSTTLHQGFVAPV